jgi:carbamoyltransferase
MLINTSFNVRGKPIVCSPEDAYVVFMKTEMDYLVIGNYLLDKNKQIQSSLMKIKKSDFILDRLCFICEYA